MASVNRVTLIGNLTRDPQTKFLPNQTPVVKFGMAMNHKWRTADGEQREDVCFIDCAAFGRPAEILQQYCHKGKQLYIEGRLKLDTWEDKQGGGKRSRHSVVIENFQFLGDRVAGGGDSDRADTGGGNSRGGYTRPPQQPTASQHEGYGDSPQIDADDIPF